MRTNLYKLMVSAALGALTFTSIVSAAAVNSKLASDVRANLSIAAEQRVIVTYADGLDETRIQGLVAKAGAGAKRSRSVMPDTWWAATPAMRRP